MISNTFSQDTTKTKLSTNTQTFKGLVALTVYTPYLNGNDISSVSWPIGGRLGDQIQTDINGQVTFSFLVEIPYRGTVDTANIGTNNQIPNLVKLSWLLELKNAVSTFQRILKINMMVNPPSA